MAGIQSDTQERRPGSPRARQTAAADRLCRARQAIAASWDRLSGALPSPIRTLAPVQFRASPATTWATVPAEWNRAPSNVVPKSIDSSPSRARKHGKNSSRRAANVAERNAATSSLPPEAEVAHRSIQSSRALPSPARPSKNGSFHALRRPNPVAHTTSVAPPSSSSSHHVGAIHSTCNNAPFPLNANVLHSTVPLGTVTYFWWCSRPVPPSFTSFCQFRLAASGVQQSLQTLPRRRKNSQPVPRARQRDRPPRPSRAAKFERTGRR